MGKIPEVIDLDTQVEKLITVFGNNMDFEDVRGKCAGEFLDVTDTLMCKEDGSAKAPHRGVDDLEEFFRAFANTRNKIAQLERDGFALAAHEVREALTHPNYRMLGEIHPFAETTPITLVLFHPEVTLQVLARVHTAEPHWCKIEDVPKGLHIPSHRNSKGFVFYQDLLNSLGDLNRPLSEKLKDVPSKHIHHRMLMQSMLLPNTHEDQDTKISHGLGYVCYAGKNDVLRRFTHQEQKQIAVWQFHLPKRYINGREGMDIVFGLHLMAEQRYWINKRGPFCSTNTFHGYGAIACPGETYHCFDKRSERFKGTRILLSL